MAADKKGAGALAMMIAGSGKPADGESEEKPYDTFNGLADAMGIPPEKRDTAKSSMKSFIQECMSDDGDAGAKDSGDSW